MGTIIISVKICLRWAKTTESSTEFNQRFCHKHFHVLWPYVSGQVPQWLMVAPVTIGYHARLEVQKKAEKNYLLVTSHCHKRYYYSMKYNKGIRIIIWVTVHVTGLLLLRCRQIINSDWQAAHRWFTGGTDEDMAVHGSTV